MVVNNIPGGGNVQISLTSIEFHIILKAMEAYQLKTWGYENHGNEGFVNAADELFTELVEAYANS